MIKEISVMRLLIATLLLALLAGSASAERVPSRKVGGQRDPGARPDVTVPYLTNGATTLGVYQGVSPLVLGKPGLGRERDANQRPVFNLIFYGSVQSANSSFHGALPRELNRLRPYR